MAEAAVEEVVVLEPAVVEAAVLVPAVAAGDFRPQQELGQVRRQLAQHPQPGPARALRAKRLQPGLPRELQAKHLPPDQALPPRAPDQRQGLAMLPARGRLRVK